MPLKGPKQEPKAILVFQIVPLLCCNKTISMSDLRQVAPPKMVKKIREQMESEFMVDGKPDFSGITSALLRFTDEREPRNMFIGAANLIRKLAKFHASPKGRKFFKKVKGFNYEDDALEYLHRFRVFFLAMAN